MYIVVIRITTCIPIIHFSLCKIQRGRNRFRGRLRHKVRESDSRAADGEGEQLFAGSISKEWPKGVVLHHAHREIIFAISK